MKTASVLPSTESSPVPSELAPSGVLLSRLSADLRSLLAPDSIIREHEPLGPKTTLRVGGPADVYVEPASEEDLAQVRRVCFESGVPFFLLGRGSNLLVRDGGLRGVVVRLSQPAFREIRVAGTAISAGAGARLRDVANVARDEGLAGLEFLHGIPGSLGGAMRMNAGAHGGWLFDVLTRVRFMDVAGRVGERPAGDVQAQYRGCPFFQHHLALGGVLEGRPDLESAIRARMDEFDRKRWATQPAQASAGCIFKNPAAAPAGRLVDEAGLKGRQLGGARVSEVHANFMVNTGGASARDVLDLIAVVRQRVQERCGVVLETEVEIVGEELPA